MALKFNPLTSEFDLVGLTQTTADARYLKIANNLSDVASVSTARTNLGLAIGTDVQAYSANLTTYAGIAPSANVQTLLGAANYAAFKTSLSLNNVENTALSTWAGTSNITTLGTIGTGTWQGTAINRAYITGLLQSDISGLTTASSPTFAGLNLGTGNLSTVGNISMGGDAARDITVATNSTTTGSNLTVQAGRAVSGGTNLQGGTLQLNPGIGVGSGRGAVQIGTYAQGSSGTTDNSLTSNALTIIQVGSGAGNIYVNISKGNTATGATAGGNSFNAIGTVAAGFGVFRNTTAATGGLGLTIAAGGATASTTDKIGGNLILVSGIPTGTAYSYMQHKTYSPVDASAVPLASGTTDGQVIDRMSVGAFKALTNNSAINIVNCTLASNTVTGGIIRYAVEVFDGTNLQLETGMITYQCANKGGVFSGNTVTQIGSAKQFLGSGTLTMTWAISGANPAVISLNANSSLTPSTGYPRITYTIENFTQQAIAIQ